MKLISAIIKPFKLDDVREALALVGVQAITVTDIKGFGRQPGFGPPGRGAEFEINFLPKLRLEVAVEDELLDKALEAIRTGAHTGKVGDGKILVFELGGVIRIRTGETDRAAI